MWRFRIGTSLGPVVLTLLPLAGFGRDLPRIQTFALDEIKGLIERNVKLESVQYRGRKAVRLTRETPGDGFGLLPDTDFQDGTIEADLALRVIAPPGVRMPGFIGIAFRARPDATRYQLFYVRPGNSLSDDQGVRNHSVQYCAEPDFGWYALRRAWPGVYEAYADLEPEAWTHMKIDVAGRAGKLYLNGSSKPSLVIDGLKGDDLRGGVALWGYANEESYFSNVRITNTAAVPIKNGSDASGVWDVRFASDAGTFESSLKLSRDGNAVTGTWSGGLGEDRPVLGTWHDGYLELTFTGSWAKESQMGAPGEVNASLAGWIDGASAKGRMKVEGRADGQWMATRRQ
jgi:hypothetical protein